MITIFKLFENNNNNIDSNIYNTLLNGTMKEKKDIIFLSKDHLFKNWDKRIIHVLIHYEVELLEYLLEFFTDIDALDFFSRTALNYAIKDNKFYHIKLLIENGADVNIGYENNLYLAAANTNTPLALKSQLIDTIEMLIDANCEWNQKFIDNLHKDYKDYFLTKYKTKYDDFIRKSKSKKFNL
jgi:ankyrin repeat protein